MKARPSGRTSSGPVDEWRRLPRPVPPVTLPLKASRRGEWLCHERVFQCPCRSGSRTMPCSGVPGRSTLVLWAASDAAKRDGHAHVARGPRAARCTPASRRAGRHAMCGPARAGLPAMGVRSETCASDEPDFRLARLSRLCAVAVLATPRQLASRRARRRKGAPALRAGAGRERQERCT
jgi:hypothetical protein